MSNKRKHNNYSKMYNEAANAEVIENVITEEVEDVTTTEPVDIVEEVETIEEVEAVKVVYGEVVNCSQLNVRSQPKSDADILLVIRKGDKIVIEENESTDEFYKVCSLPGNEGFNGYCMKKYIAINK